MSPWLLHSDAPSLVRYSGSLLLYLLGVPFGLLVGGEVHCLRRISRDSHMGEAVPRPHSGPRLPKSLHAVVLIAACGAIDWVVGQSAIVTVVGLTTAGLLIYLYVMSAATQEVARVSNGSALEAWRAVYWHTPKSLRVIVACAAALGLAITSAMWIPTRPGGPYFLAAVALIVAIGCAEWSHHHSRG